MAYKKYLLLALLLLTGTAQAASVRVSQDKIFPYAHAPINMVKNPSCAKNTANITDADSIVTANDTTPLTQGGDCAIDADADTEYAEWDVEDFSAVAGFLEGGNCEIAMHYTGDASLYEFGVFSGSTELNSDTLLNASSVNQISLNFPCGDLTTDPKIRITSTSASAAAINVAKLYIGPATNVGSVAQAEVVLSAIRASSNQTISTTAETNVIWNSALHDPYSGLNTSTGVYDVKKAGRYIIASSIFLANASVEGYVVKVKKGSTVYCSFDNTDVFSRLNPTCEIDAVVGDTLLVTVDSTADASYDILASTSSTINITRFPTASEQVFKVGFPGQDWTSWNPTFGGFGTVSSVDMRYQCVSGFMVYSGSFVVGTPTTTLGSFTLPTNYAVAGTGIRSIGSYTRAVTSANKGGSALVFPSVNDGLIYFGGLWGSAEGGGTAVQGQQAALTGETVYLEGMVPVTADSPCPRTPMPLVKQAVTMDYNGIGLLGAADVSCDATPSVDQEVGDLFTTGSQTGTGDCTWTFNKTYSVAPICQVTSNTLASASNTGIPQIDVTTTQIRVQMIKNDATGGVDQSYHITCIGPN